MSRKDTWRQKVYDAENAWRTLHLSVQLAGTDSTKMKPRMIGLEDARVVLDDLADSFAIPRVELEVNRKLKQWAGWYRRHGSVENYYQPLIEVSKPIFQYKTLLHEFAHHLDAMRAENDGKGHGGSFSQAMLDVVEKHLGREARVDLMRSYENHGVPIGVEETRKAVARSRAGISRRQERHGLIEDAWSIRLTQQLPQGDWVRYVEQDKLSSTGTLKTAGVWKRKITAEAIASSQIVDPKWKIEVVKVRAQLDTLYSNRWWAKEVVE